MKIENINIEKLIPYENNAKIHTREQIEQIMRSIEEFGFNDPIAIDEDNMIIEGHGRLMALQQLGYEEVPCIRLAGLSKKQKQAYILVHNKLTMNTGFNSDMLQKELNDIVNGIDEEMGSVISVLDAEMSELVEKIDMEAYGFVLPKEQESKPNERVRTFDKYNLEMYDEERTDGKWQMPIIQFDHVIPDDLIGFNYALSSEDKDSGIHCFVDDYQFERLWNDPENYIATLLEYQCFLSPDFSLYMDMPMAMKIWNVYRSRMIGQFYQDCGVKVIPTVSWAEPETFEFCFDGIPKRSIVAISTIGVKRQEESMKIWKDGVDEMIKRIDPVYILVYGGDVGYDFGNISVRYFDNKVTERMSRL